MPVPKAYILCEDESIIGTPFYIMSFLDGRIIEDPAMPGVSPGDRRAMWTAAVTTLAKLHSVDPDRVGLGNFGKRKGFYGRQVETWDMICAAQAGVKDIETGEPVGELPHMRELMEFFGDERTQPRDRGTLIHGDYKIDNLVFHKTEPRVIGILEWVIPLHLFRGTWWKEVLTMNTQLGDVHYRPPSLRSSQHDHTLLHRQPGQIQSP